MVHAAWGPRTKGLLLGSPSNPTGTLISRNELKGIAEFIAARGGVLMVDEIYQGLVYGLEPWTAFGLPGEVVLVNSFSKYFCMTGWRLGWVVLPADALRGFEKLAQHLFISAPAAAQHAALAAFEVETLKILEERRSEFARRRDFLVPGAEEGRAVDPGRAARRVLRLCRLRRQCPGFCEKPSRKRGGGGHAGGGLRRERHRALRALRLHPKHGRPGRGR